MEGVIERLTCETQESFALRMLKAGKVALEDIAEYSGLTLGKVRELAAQGA